MSRPNWILGPLIVLIATRALAQDIRSERLTVDAQGAPVIVEGEILGDEIIDYVVKVGQQGILFVDLKTSNAANYFNVLPAGSDEALFVGPSSGTVADVPVEAGGEFVIRTFLMRSAARRDEVATYSLAVGLGAEEFADGLSGGPDYWKVAGVGGGDAPNLREGPSTRYAVTAKLRNGDVLQNRGCRMSGDVRWCNIRATGTGVTGWVAGRYLVETAPPKAPGMPEGGPKGNGFPFDATGSIPCASAAGQPSRQCPFGVIREGPGNAGIWIALGDGAERYILFEGGIPVTTDADQKMSYATDADLFIVRVGEERYEIPDALVSGG